MVKNTTLFVQLRSQDVHMTVHITDTVNIQYTFFAIKFTRAANKELQVDTAGYDEDTVIT